MTDDLLIRLKSLPTEERPLWRSAMFEAAYEIERLEKLVTTWIICAERLVESQDGENYKKAMDFYRDCQRIAHETC